MKLKLIAFFLALTDPCLGPNRNSKHSFSSVAGKRGYTDWRTLRQNRQGRTILLPRQSHGVLRRSGRKIVRRRQECNVMHER